jgi:hypothetical protein
MARPVKEFNKEQFESLCNLQCTLDEIAGFFKCDTNTIDAWCKRTYGEGFSTTYKKHSQNGKISLRRYQLRLAERNATMAIWLGKQWLGQTDKQEVIFTEDNKLKSVQEYMEAVKNGKTKDAGRKDTTN